MSTRDSTPEPKLAPPGAGVSLPERLIFRFVMNPLVAGRENPKTSDARFERLHEKIEKTFREIPADLRGKKILVPRQLGLEDSSRFWSAAMVLEHLEIVDRGIAEMVVELSHERRIVRKVDTALVKPVGYLNPDEALVKFMAVKAELLPSIHVRVGNYNSKMTHDHPWFGPFNARKWNWLLGMHASVHLKQLCAIRDRLR